MIIPDNIKLNEEEILNIINEVVRSLSNSFTFGYYDVDDIKQEGVIIALKVLPRYDASKGASLKTFLYNHVRKRYINLRRDKYMRSAPKGLNQEELDAWYHKNNAKRNLIDTVDIDDEKNSEKHDSFDMLSSYENKELLVYIDKNLAIDMRADYRRFLENVKLPKYRYIALLEELRKLHYEYNTKKGR